jgi:hypothetical protein
MSRKNSSFAYKTINSSIRAILDARSNMNNTVQMAMPFVKATTTVGNMNDILGEGNIGFTLGVHGYPDQNLLTENIYTPQGGYPLIGYTYTSDGSGVKLIEANLDSLYMSRKESSIDIKKMIQFFDNGAELYSSGGEGSKIVIPPPGITGVNITRNRAGVVSAATINFSVPILPQLEMLHRTFLIPGVGMVLEWGQQFAKDTSIDYGEGGLTDSTIQQNTFPWYDVEKRTELFEKLRLNRYGFPDLLRDYVYPTQGQYMWMFGRVGNFDVKSNSDGSYECSVKIVGPAEDSWAYSVVNTVLPPKDLSGTICVEDANSVATYFANTTDGLNLKSLLETVQNDTNHPWHKHVIKFEKPANSEGEPTVETTDVNLSEDKFFNTKDSYFFTWRFFVNVVLNDEEVGVKKIFKKAGLTDAEIGKIALLQPYADGPDRRVTDVANISTLNDPYESFVGYNKFLRSHDPGTMIIINNVAVREAIKYINEQRPTIREQLFADSPEAAKMASLGSFTESTRSIPLEERTPPPQKPNQTTQLDKGFLSTGVWLNHKRVAQCMVGADTVIMGITNLLQNMSGATSGFWQLALDISEPDSESGGERTAYNYSVIDINYRENSTRAVDKLLKGEERIHVFNKYIRSSDGQLRGSDVIDCTVDLALPKRMFSQIATLGLVQPKDIQAATGEEQTDPDAPGMNAVAGDVNEALRKMFAITSISPENGVSVDLTMPTTDERKKWFAGKTCGQVESNTTAGTGGANNSAAPPSTDALAKKEDLEKEIEKLKKDLESDKCKQCTQTTTPATQPTQTTTPATQPTPTPAKPPLPGTADGPATLPKDTRNYIENTPWSAGFISYVMQASGTSFPAAGAHVTYSNSIRKGFSGWSALDPATTSLRVGDVVVVNRCIKFEGKKCVQMNNLRFDSATWSGPTHGDIVTSISDGKIVTLGGNVADTVKITTYKSTSTGTIVAATGAIVVLRPSQQQASKIVDTANAEYQKWFSNKWVETNPAAFDSLNAYYKAGKLTNTLKGPSNAQVASPASRDPLGTFRTANGSEGEGKITDILVPRQSVGGKTALVVQLDTGKVVRRIGNRNWRNHNPGNLEFGKTAKKFGAIGSDVRFAIFPDYQSGRAAKEFLLFINPEPNGKGNIYKNMTVRQAIADYAPPNENDTAKYQRLIIEAVGGDFVLGTLTTEQRNRMLNAMERFEGYVPGTIEVRDSPSSPPQPTTTPTVTAAPQSVRPSRQTPTTSPQCVECNKNKQLLEQKQKQLASNNAIDNKKDEIVRLFPGLERVFKYIELFPEWMISNIRGTADGNSSNAFGASPGALSIAADITLPGINGLRIGELFWLDRIPAFYRTFGAFQIINLTDSIDVSNGWTTKINARFNYLGVAWRDEMYSRIEIVASTQPLPIVTGSNGNT